MIVADGIHTIRKRVHVTIYSAQKTPVIHSTGKENILIKRSLTLRHSKPAIEHILIKPIEIWEIDHENN